MSITNSAYYEMLMVWKKLTVEKRDVQLPEAPYSVKVHFRTTSAVGDMT